MTDWGASGRRDEYSLHLVDPFSLMETGEVVDMIQGTGNITWRRDAENIVSASLHLANATHDDKLVRVKQATTFPNGEQHARTLGTFFVDGSSASALYGSVDRTVQGYSLLYRYTNDVLARDFARTAGTVIVDEVRDLVEIDGGNLRILPGVNQSQQHTIDIWFEVGTNRYDVLTTIARWTNCELGIDENGYVTWGPYTAPESKAIDYTFEDGANCTYKPGFDLEDTGYESINRVVAYFSRDSKQDDDPYPLSDSVYVDLDASEAYSYERIGVRKSYLLSASEPCSHEELTAQAQRELFDRKGGVKYITIEHVGIPDVQVGSVVRYINGTDASVPMDRRCLVEEISMDLDNGAMCTTKLRLL